MYKWPLMQNTITWGDKLAMIKFIAFTDKFTNGEKVREFERKWSEWLGCKHSLFVSSGSAANLLLVDAIKEKYKLKNGDKILLPACTWVTTVSPFLQCGLTPIFCDINLTDFSFDLDHMKKIAKEHPDIKLISVTHLLGFRAELDFFQSIFPKAIIIEDLCESHGITDPYTGSRQGSSSLGSTFSFYFGHHMTTIEGGMISTYDQELLDLMTIKRSHGMARLLPLEKYKQAQKDWPDVNPKFLFMTSAWNFRNTEINAVLGLNQLPRLDSAIRIRQSNYASFRKIISQYPDKFYLPTDATTNSNFALPFITKDPANKVKLLDAFEKAGIESRPIVSGNLLRQPFLKNYKLEDGSKQNIEILHNNGVYVGNNHFVGDVELEMLADVIKNLMG